MSSKVWLSSPHMSGKEMSYIQEAFDTNWIAPLGKNVDQFEIDLSKYTGSPHVAALSSGTAAIHLALILLGVSSGDEVLCSSFTFSASANPIKYVGAIPVFIDSENETWNVCPQTLELAIKDRIKKGKKPKAFILVHLYGVPAKLDEIMAVCNEYGIPVIEDAAEALGSTYKGKAVGTFGIFGVCSFNGNKIITTSGGGALFSSSAESIAKCKFLATQARDAAPHYQHSEIGYNYRLSNVLAGIGIGQLQVIDQRVQKRRSNYKYYQDAFKGLNGISFLDDLNGHFSNRWLSTILVHPEKTNGVTREVLRIALEKANIESRPLWKPMHQQPVFADCPYYGNGVSDALFEKGLCLPSGSNISDEDLVRVTEVIKGCFA